MNVNARMRTEMDLNESEIGLNESEIDLNECEHFLKVNSYRSEIDPSWIPVLLLNGLVVWLRH